MSFTRLIIRLVLVALLIGTGVILFRAWRNSKPEFLQARAEAALAAGKPQAARIDLQNLVERFPEDPKGHKLLAQAILAEAKAADQPATYGRQPDALRQLMAAAKLAPEDLELQKELVQVFVDGGKPADGSTYAERVLEAEPDNLDALFCVAVPEVEAKSKAAAPRLEKLLAAKDYRRSEVLKLAAVYYDRTKKPEEFQQVLTLSADEAAAIPAEKLNELTRVQMEPITRLFVVGVDRAPNASVALDRLSKCVDTYEKFPTSEPALLSDIAQQTSEMMMNLARRFPAAADTAEQKLARQTLQARIDKIRAAAVEKDVAGPFVFQQAALAAFNAGENEKAAELIKQGLTVAEKKPGVRPHDALELHLLAARNYVIMRKARMAQPHLDKLLADKDYVGWGELLSGGIASSEGRHEKAYQHFLTAQKKLGTILFVQMGLANSCLSLGKWNEALPHLQALHKSFDKADIELQAWANLNGISTANVHFGQFRAYLALNDWENAQKHLAALSGTSLADRAQAMAIIYLWSRGNREEALSALSAARRANPNDLMLLRLQAGLLQQSGKTEEAGQLLKEDAEKNPGDLTRQMLLVRWKIGQKQFPEAIEQLTALETQFPNEIEPPLLKAQLLMVTGEFDQGVAIAEKLKTNPKAAAAASFLLAAADLKRKDPEAAAKEVAAIEANLPNHGLINLLQGEVAAAQGDYASVIDHVGDSLDVTPLRAQARGMLLKSLLMLSAEQGPAAAEAKLLPLLQQNPDDSFLNIAMADLKFKQGQFDTAMKLLDRAEQLDPGTANVPYIKASIWLQRQRLDAAASESERAVGIDPKHIPSRMLAAQLAMLQQKYQVAYNHAQAVLAQAPGYVPMLLVQANALAALRRQPDAIALLEKAIAQQPQAAALYDRLMSLQFEAGKKDQALATVRMGRQKLPDDLLLAADEVTVLCQLDKLNEAQQVAQNFTKDKKAPTDVDRYLTMAQSFFRSQKFDAARDWANQGLAIADEKVRPAIHLILGDISLSELEMSGLKNSDLATQARDHFAEVIAVQPANFVAGNNLAWLLATEFNQAEEAAKVIDGVRGKATVEQMPINFIDTVAVVYRKANRLEEAQQVLERATAMYQENPLLLYQLALVQNDRKLYSAARTNLERAVQLGVPAKYKDQSAKLMNELRNIKDEGAETPTSTTDSAK